MKMRPFLAAILLCAALPLSANEEPSLLQRGETLLNEGKLPEALEILQQAVVADPNSSRAFKRLGGAQLMSQDYAGSILSFQRAIRLDANNAEAFIGMGMAYLHSGRYGLARSALEEAKRIDPTKQPKIDEIITWLDQRVAH
jgi:tetratricopeptide (TPR) repeat protein